MFLVRIDIDGLDSVHRMLRGWSPPAQRRMLRPAITKGSRRLASAVRREAPNETGLLRSSVGYFVRTYKNTGAVVGVIGPRKGFKKPVFISSRRSVVLTPRNVAAYHHAAGRVVLRDPARYARIVHDGARPHAIVRRSGAVIAHPGAAPNRFVDRAVRSSWQAVSGIIVSEVKARLLATVRARLLGQRR